MSNIKIVCDSLSDIPQDLVKEYDIHITPLSVMFGEKEYVDGIDLSKQEFYKLLRESDVMPKTSQVTYMAFKEVFEKYVKEGKQVLYIGGSSNLSGTYQSGMMAKNDVEGDVYTFDTLSVCIGAGSMAISAAEMAREGKTIDEIIAHLEKIRENCEVLFTVDTLEYLKKGGRISGASAAIGSMLNIKPILEMQDGKVEARDKVRGKKQVVAKIADIIKSKFGEDLTNKRVIIACGDNEEEFETFKLKLGELLNIEEFKETYIGSVITSHSGPSVFGIGICDK